MAKHYALCFVILFVGGEIITRFFNVKDSKAHWYFTHALANAYISYCTISDVFYCFQQPEIALFRPIEMDSINYTGAIMLGALHLYHTIAYWSEITAADVFHHVTFVPFNQIAIFWPILANWESMGLQWGSNINMINFF